MSESESIVAETALRIFQDLGDPQTIGVVETRAQAFGWKVIIGDPASDLDPDAVFAALLSYPGSSGAVRDFKAVIARLENGKALSILATDLLALALLVPPGELGADIAVGSSQRFGVPMGYGGPHAAFFADPITLNSYSSDMPPKRSPRQRSQLDFRTLSQRNAAGTGFLHMGEHPYAASIDNRIDWIAGLDDGAELFLTVDHKSTKRCD